MNEDGNSKIRPLKPRKHNFFNQEKTWKIFANHHGCPLDPKSPLIARAILKEFLTFFSNSRMSYKVKIEDVQSWKTTHYPDIQDTISYVLSRGKNRFQLINTQTGVDKLEVLDSYGSRFYITKW